MIARFVAVVMGLAGAVSASQLPEFTQQYRQRIGGAIDELRRIVQRFDDNARLENLDRAGWLARKRSNADPAVRREADHTERDVERLARLEKQRVTLAQSGPATRIVHFLTGFDGDLVKETYRDFKPAVPVSMEGFFSAGAGFLLGLGIAFGAGRGARKLVARRPRGESEPMGAGAAASAGRESATNAPAPAIQRREPAMPHVGQAPPIGSASIKPDRIHRAGGTIERSRG